MPRHGQFMIRRLILFFSADRNVSVENVPVSQKSWRATLLSGSWKDSVSIKKRSLQLVRMPPMSTVPVQSWSKVTPYRYDSCCMVLCCQVETMQHTSWRNTSEICLRRMPRRGRSSSRLTSKEHRKTRNLLLSWGNGLEWRAKQRRRTRKVRMVNCLVLNRTNS